MTDAELLEKVKSAMGITGNYLDPALSVHIGEVKCFMEDAGLSTETVNSSRAVGVICRGVSDLWNGMPLDDYFKQRVSQMVYKEAL